MSLEEFEKASNPRRKKNLMKSVMDLAMGIIYLGVGVLIIFSKRIGFDNDFANSPLAKVFAGLVILYGAWRIYRGLKKDYYYRDDD